MAAERELQSPGFYKFQNKKRKQHKKPSGILRRVQERQTKTRRSRTKSREGNQSAQEK